jgi:DMSO/TMAO reductase YedYZ molybdopterin-dependent catalytic subunit
MAVISRAFGRRRADGPATLPPGQHLVDGFPVLATGPTPRMPLDGWTLEVTGAVDRERRLSWEEFRALPAETFTCDLHCVTAWSKLGTRWQGVSVDTVLDGAGVGGAFVWVECEGGYTTNLRLTDVTGGRAWIAFTYDDAPLEPTHGGPARLLVPHLYLWKSAKWVRRLVILDRERRGYWESFRYHDRGDPWREQRYRGD